jgi:hypothetical protein
MDNGSQINTFAMNHMYHLIMVKKIKPLKTVERDFEMNQLQVERKTDQAIYGCSKYRSSGVITLAGAHPEMANLPDIGVGGEK